MSWTTKLLIAGGLVALVFLGLLIGVGGTLFFVDVIDPQNPQGTAPTPAPAPAPAPDPRARKPFNPEPPMIIHETPPERSWGGPVDLWLRRSRMPVGQWEHVGTITNDTRVLPLYVRWRNAKGDGRYDYAAKSEDKVWMELLTDVPWLWTDDTLTSKVLGTGDWKVYLFDGTSSAFLRLAQ